MWKSSCFSDNRKKIVGFLVALLRSSDILVYACLVLLPYSSDGTTAGVLWVMAKYLLLTD